MTIEGICNQALSAIGYTRHIGNIYEGTKAARVALDFWGQTRDALLERLQPDWSHRNATLVLLKSAPNIVNGMASYTTPWDSSFPELPWLYEYEFPADCITPIQIKGQTSLLPIWRPRAQQWRVSDSLTILSNAPNAILVYVGQVTNPDNWHNDFIELMVATLAKKFEMELSPHPQQPQQQKDANAPG